MSTSSTSNTNAAASSSSAFPAPHTLPAQLKASKRPSSSKAEATVVKKRQKTSVESSRKTQAATVFLDREWEAKVAATNAWRENLSELVDAPLVNLLKSLNVVRKVDQRPLITDAQAATIPDNERLHAFLLEIFASPLSWKASNFTDVACLLDDGSSEIDQDLAQYYIRRLAFPDHAAVKAILDGVSTENPHYGGQCKNLLAASQAISSGVRYLGYGGYTVANSPVGRDLDDKADPDQGSLLKYILAKYEGSILIYNIPDLSFRIGNGARSSVKASRRDDRTGFFESLVVDSFGFLSLNTAAPGITIEVEPSEEFLAVKAAIQAI